MTDIFIDKHRSKPGSPVAVDVDDIDEIYLYGQLASLGPENNPERELFAKS